MSNVMKKEMQGCVPAEDQVLPPHVLGVHVSAQGQHAGGRIGAGRAIGQLDAPPFTPVTTTTR